MFPSRFLKASDLNGKPMIVTVEGVTRETLKTPDGKSDEKPVLFFAAMKKCFPCNITNWDSIAEFCGEDSDMWPGHQLELFPTKTRMGSETVDCIRIRRPPTPRGLQPKKPAAPKPPKKGGKGAKSSLRDEMADEIPFLGAKKND